jgi:hypothetical protein
MSYAPLRTFALLGHRLITQFEIIISIVDSLIPQLFNLSMFPLIKDTFG